MRSMTLLALGGFATLFSAMSAAECERPRPSFEVPQGSSASEPDLAATQQQLVKFADQVADYLRCLSGEVSQKSIGQEPAKRTELARAHEAAHQEAANELRGLADCFNAELESFKSTGGGTQKQSTDCSSHISAAASNAQTAGRAATTVVVEASGHSFDVPSGNWIYYLVRSDSLQPCERQAGAQCLYRAVLVRNDSNEVLECQGDITYESAADDGSATTRSQALIQERTTGVVAWSLAAQGTDATTFEARCTRRAPLAALDTPANCRYEVVQPVAVADYYPPASRTAEEEGPVTVEFTLRGKAARPTDVRAVASSMYESLDQAAVKAVSDMVMSSNCPNARYRLRLNFQLQE